MWFGLLTPGTHPCRSSSAPGVVTLSCWNDIARIREDGPVEDVATGMRQLRAFMRERGQAPCPPRCFTCATPYAVPDPDEIASSPDIEEMGARRPHPDARTADADADAARALVASGWRGPAAPPATLVLVHLGDAEADTDEVLLLVPVPRVALLVPLGRLADVLLLVAGSAARGEPPLRCDHCGALAPGRPAPDADGGNRAARRRAVARGAGRSRRRRPRAA